MKKLLIFILFSSIFLIACGQPIKQENNSFKTSFFSRSVGKLPSLLYGLGDDRLGGAKMGYIDTGILFKVVDSNITPWKVQLSKYRTAFIDKVYLKPDTSIKEKPFHLTEKFNVFGTDSCYDIITILMDEKLPFRSWMQPDPASIQIEVFGVQSNTNWITQLPSTLKEIKNVYYRQSEEDVLLVTIDLKHNAHWGYTINYINNQLIIKVKRQPENLDIKNIKIAIDAGHGGSNIGAEGETTHIIEKNYTLLFAKQLEKYLKNKGVKNVIMTREKDTTLDMKDRIITLQQQNPDILISFHLNSNSDKTVKGCGTFYRHIGFRPVSLSILKRMQEIGLAEYANVGSFNFGLNGPTDFINCLLEVGFLSNIDDEKKLANPKFHKQTAMQVFKGISDWLKSLKN